MAKLNKRRIVEDRADLEREYAMDMLLGRNRGRLATYRRMHENTLFGEDDKFGVVPDETVFAERYGVKPFDPFELAVGDSVYNTAMLDYLKKIYPKGATFNELDGVLSNYYSGSYGVSGSVHDSVAYGIKVLSSNGVIRADTGRPRRYFYKK